MMFLKTKVGQVFTLIGLLFPFVVLPQYSINGPASVDQGDVHNYAVFPNSNIRDVYWTSSRNNPIARRTLSETDITFVSGSNDILYVEMTDAFFNNYFLNYSVNVTQTVPAKPADPTVTSNGCGESTIGRTGTPPSGVRWYWQGKNSSGRVTNKGSGSSFIANEGSGTYYIRARDNNSLEWSFELGSVSVTVPTDPDAPTVTMVPSCNGGSATLTASGGGTGASYRWYTASGTYLTTTTTYRPTISSNTTYQVRAKIGNCLSTAVTVVAEANAPTLTVTDGENGCTTPDSATMTAESIGIPSGTSGVSHKWYTTETGSAYVSGTTVSGPVFRTTITVTEPKEYWVSVVKDGCESNREKVSASFSSTTTPVLELIDNDGPQCAPATFGLLARGGASGSVYEWYSSPSGGTPVHTGASFSPTLSAIGETTYYVGGVLKNGLGCEFPISPREPISVTVKARPGIPVVVDDAACGNDQITFTATPQPGQVFLWYTADDIFIQQGPSFTTPVLSENTDYRVSGSLDGCEGPRQTITAVLNALPAEPSATGTARCGAGQISLTAVPGAGADQIRWYTSAVGGTPLSTGVSANTLGYTANLSVSTTYYLESYNSDNGCFSSARIAVQASITDSLTWYDDSDGDGLGDASISITQCDRPTGFVLNNTDLCPDISSETNDCGSGMGYTPENYVYTRMYQKNATDMGIPTTTSIPFFTANEDLIQDITYYDGLGRPLQQIAIGQSGGNDAKDVVSHIEYDAYGRQSKEWLPLFAPNDPLASLRSEMETTTKAYYENRYQGRPDFEGRQAQEINPYSETVFEPSPLNRIVKQAAPGNDWATGSGHEIEYAYGTNTSSDDVRAFEALVTKTTENSIAVYTPSLQSNGAYAAGELSLTITYDENHTAGKNHSMEEFIDRQGRTVLKRTYADIDKNLDGDTDDNGESQVAHDTYYVYDVYGNLSYVLPPKVTVNNGVNNTEMAQLCYQYKYDNRNRLVEKKIPGKDWEYIVYDKLDRPILTQQYRYRNSRNWLFTKYDAFGRVIYTGIYQHGTKLTGTQMQQLVNDTNTGDQFERKLATASGNNYYSKDHFPNGNTTAFPGSKLTPLTYDYYDDYVFNKNGLVVPNKVFGVSASSRTRGLLTGTRVRMIHTNKWIVTMNGFDNKGRIIWTGTKNLFLGITDRTLFELDFLGRTKRQRLLHKKNNKAQITINETFTYDDAGRLTEHRHKIGDGPNMRIAGNTYDDLVQLTQKEVGGVVNATALQKIDYRYNIRGWLTDINEVGTMGNDLFGMSIQYNDGDSGNDLFNGNIPRVYWRTANTDNSLKSYTYTYDALNRITGATDDTGRYDVSDIDYDKNGNILRLQRAGLLSGTGNNYGVIDDLTYSYLNNGQSNRLEKVVDASGNDMGFRDGTNTNADYSYDTDGNLKKDRNKNITQNMGYNHLNLPTVVKFGGGSANRVNYYYDALGIKHRKQVREGNTVTATTNYFGPAVYQGNNLEFITHSEGYTMPNDASDYSQGFSYIYQYMDYLGNVRLSYQDADNDGSIDPANEIIEENNYYPFGLEHKGYNNIVNGTENNYQTFMGKEHQQELGLETYDFGARNYDPALGRWMNLDPLAEQMRRHSPYNFAFDNPIRFIDPDGMAPFDVVITGNQADEAFNQLQSSVQNELTLSKDANGKVTYTKNGEGDLSSDAQQLANAIDDSSVVVNVNATDSQTTSEGDLFIGGAFGGNEITNEGELAETGNTLVIANQEVNPAVLGAADEYNGTEGSLVLHEVTEAYQGAQIVKEDGVSVGPATSAQAADPTSVYSRAHSAATPQNMNITETVYDAAGNVLRGTYTGAVRAEYSVQQGNRPRRVIMTFPDN